MSKRSSLKSVQMIEIFGRIYDKMSVYIEEGRPIPVGLEKIAGSLLPWLEKLESMVDALDHIHNTLGPVKSILDHIKRGKG